jgi:hypothetical protein
MENKSFISIKKASLEKEAGMHMRKIKRFTPLALHGFALPVSRRCGDGVDFVGWFCQTCR